MNLERRAQVTSYLKRAWFFSALAIVLYQPVIVLQVSRYVYGISRYLIRNMYFYAQ